MTQTFTVKQGGLGETATFNILKEMRMEVLGAPVAGVPCRHSVILSRDGTLHTYQVPWVVKATCENGLASTSVCLTCILEEAKKLGLKMPRGPVVPAPAYTAILDTVCRGCGWLRNSTVGRCPECSLSQRAQVSPGFTCEVRGCQEENGVDIYTTSDFTTDHRHQLFQPNACLPCRIRNQEAILAARADLENEDTV